MGWIFFFSRRVHLTTAGQTSWSRLSRQQLVLSDHIGGFQTEVAAGWSRVPDSRIISLPLVITLLDNVTFNTQVADV